MVVNTRAYWDVPVIAVGRIVKVAVAVVGEVTVIDPAPIREEDRADC